MILVTGATGHIGNVLVRQLLEEGESVRVLSRGHRPAALEGLEVEIARGDVLDSPSLANAMRGVEVVYHLAARISLTTGTDPETEQVNLQGTRNVLIAMRDAQVRRLIYASSIYAFKEPVMGEPIDESQPFQVEHGRGAYDASKAKATLEVLKAASQGLDAVIVCPTAVTGPYDFHGSEAGRAIQLYMRPGLKFLLEGAYDFVDVRDVARGCLLAAEKGRRGEAYILGGERLTLREVAETVWNATGIRPASLTIPLWLAHFVAGLVPSYVRLTGARPLFTRYSLDAVTSNSYISHARASRELGYAPGPARQAILDSVRWFRACQEGVEFSEIEPGVVVQPSSS